MNVLRLPAVRALAVTAVLASFVAQFRWAVYHGFATFPWRWPATAAAVFLLLSPLLLVLRFRTGDARARWEQGLRLLPVLGLLPLFSYVSNSRNRAAVAVFFVALFLFLLRTRGSVAERGESLVWPIRITVAAALLWAALAPVPLDGVTLKLSGPRQGDYFWASREAPSAENTPGSGGTFRSDSQRGVVTVPVTIPDTRDRAAALRVGLGETHTHTELHAMSFDSSLLTWNFPLASLNAQELLARGMVPAESAFAKQGTHVLVTSKRTYGTAVSIPLATVEPAAAGSPWRQLAFRGLWLLAVAGVLLLARRAATLDAAAWLRPWVGLRKILFSAPDAPPQSLRSFYRERIGWIAAGIVLLLALLFVRSGPNILNPGLYVEDGSYCFARFYGGEQPLTDSFQKWNRYMSLVYSVAWLVAKADVLWQPTLYVWSTLLMALLASSLLSFSGLLRDRLTLLFAPTVLGLSGILHVFLWVTLVYQMHVTVLSLVVLLLFPPPETRAGAALQALAMTYFVWSAPFSVVAVPLALLLLVLRLYPGRKKVAMLVFAIVCTLLYYLTTVGGTTQLFALLQSPEMREHYFVLLVEKILLLGVFGAYSHWKLLVVLAGVAAMTYRFRRDTLYVKVSVALWFAILTGHAVYFLSMKYDPWLHLPHYLQVSLYCWWIYLLITLDRVISGLRVPRGLAVAAWGLVLALVAYDNVLHPDKGAYPLHASIPEFLKTVKQYEPQAELLRSRNEAVHVWTPAMFGGGPVDDRDWSPMARIGSRQLDARVTEVFVPFDTPKVR